MSKSGLDSVPTPAMEVLSQEIEMESCGYSFGSPECVGRYRLRIGGRIRYLVIRTNVFNEDTMSIPSLLIPSLPGIPDGSWTVMTISKSSNGEIETSLSTEPLQGVEHLWHSVTIDVLSCPQVRKLKSEVFETVYQGKRAVAKIADFDWKIGGIDHETFIYSLINKSEQAQQYTPTFISHIHEEDRTMGFMVEFIPGRPANKDDLERCQEALIWLHDLGILHGDVNRHNFIVDESGHVRMIDFMHSKPWSEEAAERELQELQSELEDTSARGAPFSL